MFCRTAARTLKPRCGYVLLLPAGRLARERSVLGLGLVRGHVVGVRTAVLGFRAAENALCLDRIRLMCKPGGRLTRAELILVELIVLDCRAVVQYNKLLPRDERAVAVADDGCTDPLRVLAAEYRERQTLRQLGDAAD